MKKIYIMTLVCLLAVTTLAAETIRGIPWGSSESYIMSAEKCEFLGKKQEIETKKDASITIDVLEFKDTMLGRPAVIKYKLWDDKLYEVWTTVQWRELTDNEKAITKKAIMDALIKKYGKPDFDFVEMFIWSKYNLDITSIFAKPDYGVVYVWQPVKEQMDKEFEKLQKSFLQDLGDLNKL